MEESDNNFNYTFGALEGPFWEAKRRGGEERKGKGREGDEKRGRTGLGRAGRAGSV